MITWFETGLSWNLTERNEISFWTGYGEVKPGGLPWREEIPAKDADPGGCWCVVGGSSVAGCEPCDGEALL